MSIKVYEPNSLFLHIPKTAGRAICHWLIVNTECDYVTHITDKKDRAHWYSHEILSWLDTREKRGFTWTVVRNPYSRMVSAYRYRKRDCSFRDYLLSIGDVRNDGHMMKRQVDQVLPDTDLILRFESLDTEFKKVQKFYNVYKPLRRVGTPEMLQGANWRDFYDEETQDIVHSLYEEDFKQFNYSPELL